MSDKIVIYTKIPCPYCDAAKSFFRSKNLKFEEHDLTGQFEEMSKLKERTGHRTFPQIYVGERFIGGYDDMMALVKSGELKF